MLPPREDPVAAPSRRAVLRALGGLGLAGLGAAATACSAADREAMRAVDPGDVRLDEGVLPVPAPPAASARELRRRQVRAGSLAAVAAYAAASAAGPAPVLHGRTGGAADLVAATGVHRVHAEVLAGQVPSAAAPPAGPAAAAPPGAGVPGLLPAPSPAPDGPAVPPGSRPAVVLRAGGRAALQACAGERAAADADVALAVLHARVAAARTAQAAALDGTDGADGGPVWPSEAPAAEVVAALEELLAQEHRARWSYAVVQAWATDRGPDAADARRDHARRTEDLAAALAVVGGRPVDAAATYPTDDAGRPVDGPVGAAALALRCEEAVTAAAAGLLVAAVGAAPSAAWAVWVRAAVRSLAGAERARWSWGGQPVPWPGA